MGPGEHSVKTTEEGGGHQAFAVSKAVILHKREVGGRQNSLTSSKIYPCPRQKPENLSYGKKAPAKTLRLTEPLLRAGCTALSGPGLDSPKRPFTLPLHLTKLHPPCDLCTVVPPHLKAVSSYISLSNSNQLRDLLDHPAKISTTFPQNIN